MTQRLASIGSGVLGLVIAGFLVGCAGENWDWFGMNREKKDDRPVTKARRPVDSPAVAAADQPANAPSRPTQDDAKAKEVDEKVERYVRSMNNSYDPNYESNDFRAKMRRQSDPARSERIRQTAAMSRDPAPNSAEIDATGTTHGETNPPGAAGTTDTSTPGMPSDSAETTEKSGDQDSSPVFPTSPDKHQDESSAVSETPDEKKATPESDHPISEHVSAESDSPREPNKPATPVRPPVITDISVSAGEAPKDSTDTPPTKSPTASPTSAAPVTAPPPEPVVIDTFKQRLAEQESLAAKDANNVVEQFKLRLLYLADGQEDKALAPSPGMNPDLAQLMQAQLRSLIAARSTAERDPALWANKQMESIEQLRNLVRSRADLSVPKVALCKEIISFGQFTPFEPAEFKAGVPNRVALYVEIDNFMMERTSSGMHRVLLSMRQSLMRKSGEELWNKRDENIEDLSRRPRRDFYLTAEHVIPKSLEPGEYLFKVEVEDVLAGKINSNTVHFKLVP